MGAPSSDPQRLLLAFIAHVEQTGLCGYPPLEAHLHRHASRPQPAEPRPEPAAEQECSTPPEADAEPEAEAALPAPIPTPVAPAENREPPPTATQPATQPATQLAPAPAQPALSPEAATGALDVIEAEVIEAEVSEEREEKVAVAEVCTPQPRPARAAAARQVHTVADSGEGPTPDPVPELLLRFREQVRSSGYCDHPALQQRLEDRIAQRSPNSGNDQLALDCQRQACLSQLQQGLATLAALNAQVLATPHHAAIPQTIATVVMLFTQVRELLADGLSSYGLPPDSPQRNLLQRLLRRAARQEQQVQRQLRRGAATGSVLVALQALALVLRNATLQWMPDQAAQLQHHPVMPAPTASIEEPRSGLLRLTRRGGMNSIRLRRARRITQPIPPVS